MLTVPNQTCLQALLHSTTNTITASYKNMPSSMMLRAQRNQATVAILMAGSALQQPLGHIKQWTVSNVDSKMDLKSPVRNCSPR